VEVLTTGSVGTFEEVFINDLIPAIDDARYRTLANG
jgi:hypothetical protein